MTAMQSLYQRRFASNKVRQTPWRTVRIPRRDAMFLEKTWHNDYNGLFKTEFGKTNKQGDVIRIMNPTVSIIVPVYNAQEYLRRCIDSILNQEYGDFELLLSDDGSQDESGKICDEYAARDPRVRVIHKENSGVSDTRNRAMRLAKGMYLQFVDSDDWLTPDATRLLVRTAQEHDCDMVIADFYRVVGERVSHKGDIEEDRVLSREEFAGFMMENPADFYYGVLWNKLYRREIVERYHLRMDVEINWCEDFMFNLEYIRHAERFYALRTPIYYYVKRKGSLAAQGMSITKTVKMKLMVFEYYNNFYKHVLDEDDYEKNRLQVYRFLIDPASDGMIWPSVLTGAKKLGNERSLVCQETLEEDGMIADAYRERKLLEHYLEPAALKYNLTFMELRILMYVADSTRRLSRKKLADLMGISRAGLSVSLQRLSARGFLQLEEIKGEKGKAKERQILLSLLPEAAGVIEECRFATADYKLARVEGFSPEEIQLWEEFQNRVKRNTQKILQQPLGR